MTSFRFLFLAVVSTFAVGCASAGSAPSDLRDAVEGKWQTESGTTLSLTVGDRGADCTDLADCTWANRAQLHVTTESARCGAVQSVYGTVTWTDDGQRMVRLAATTAYEANGDVVGDSIALHDVAEHAMGVKNAEATCLWNELSTSSSLTRVK